MQKHRHSGARPLGASPESITTNVDVARSWGRSGDDNRHWWLWIPGSLRFASRPGMTSETSLRPSGTTGKIALHTDPKSVA